MLTKGLIACFLCYLAEGRFVKDKEFMRQKRSQGKLKTITFIIPTTVTPLPCDTTAEFCVLGCLNEVKVEVPFGMDFILHRDGECHACECLRSLEVKKYTECRKTICADERMRNCKKKVTVPGQCCQRCDDKHQKVNPPTFPPFTFPPYFTFPPFAGGGGGGDIGGFGGDGISPPVGPGGPGGFPPVGPGGPGFPPLNDAASEEENVEALMSEKN